MEDFRELGGALILGPLMFVVGLQLTGDDFRRVLSAPRAVIGGTLGQLVLLPLMTLALVILLPVSPYVAAGALLVSATPGAGMSNVMAAVSRSDVALPVSLTAFSSVLSVLTIPLATTLGNNLFLDEGLNIAVPAGRIMLQLILFLAVPIGMGMWVRKTRPEAAKRYVPRANRIAVIAIIVLTLLGMLMTNQTLPEGVTIGWATAAAAAWTVCAMAIGFGLGTLLRLTPPERFAYLSEFGERNMALAVVVAVASLGSLDLALFPMVYAIAGSPLVLLLAITRRDSYRPTVPILRAATSSSCCASKSHRQAPLQG